MKRLSLIALACLISVSVVGQEHVGWEEDYSGEWIVNNKTSSVFNPKVNTDLDGDSLEDEITLFYDTIHQMLRLDINLSKSDKDVNQVLSINLEVNDIINYEEILEIEYGTHDLTRRIFGDESGGEEVISSSEYEDIYLNFHISKNYTSLPESTAKMKYRYKIEVIDHKIVIVGYEEEYHNDYLYYVEDIRSEFNLKKCTCYIEEKAEPELNIEVYEFFYGSTSSKPIKLYDGMNLTDGLLLECKETCNPRTNSTVGKLNERR